MLLLEDLALVPMIFVDRAHRRSCRHARPSKNGRARPLRGRSHACDWAFRAVRPLRTGRPDKNPELFLAISLLTVILASLATRAVGLSPILGALIAGILIAETDYHAEVEAIAAPLAGLALGIFLITVGMRIDLHALNRGIGRRFSAPLRRLMIAKAAVTAISRSVPRGSGPAVAIEAGILMASPSETSLIVLSTAAPARAS